MAGTGCAGRKTEKKEVPVAPVRSGPVTLVWQHKNDPSVDLSRLDKVPGINVVSPVWYTVSNEYGLVEDRTEPGYVERAHAKGYQVWPLISNGFNPDRTHQVLKDPHAQRFVIDQVLALADTHHFDGINIDFENIYEKDRDALTAFVAYMRRQVKGRPFVLSMDVTVPSDNPNWSRCYDRKALSREVDYLVLMTYDQYPRLSTVPGPTASYNWDEKGVKATLAGGVPAEKIVFGIPLYMRLWKDEGKTGTYKAQTLSMKGAEALIREKSSLPTWKREWLPEEKMVRCSYEEDGNAFVFWQEDALSLYYKTRLIPKYKLAGLAAWRFGFETSDVWRLLPYGMTKPAD
jgi:spore germination protein YaaH